MRRCDAGMPVSVPAPCMQTIPTIASTKFLVILLHISEDRLVVVVVVSAGDTRRHGDTDTGHWTSAAASLICLMSHLSRYKQIHRHTGRGHGFMRAMRCSLSGCGSAFNVYVTPSVCLFTRHKVGIINITETMTRGWLMASIALR